MGSSSEGKAGMLSFRSNFYRNQLPKDGKPKTTSWSRYDANTTNKYPADGIALKNATEQQKMLGAMKTEGIYQRGGPSPAKDRPVAKPYDGKDFTTTFLAGQKTIGVNTQGVYERGAKSPAKDRPVAKPYDGKDFTTSFISNQARVSRESKDDFLARLEQVEKNETSREQKDARRPSVVKSNNPGAGYSASSNSAPVIPALNGVTPTVSAPAATKARPRSAPVAKANKGPGKLPQDLDAAAAVIQNAARSSTLDGSAAPKGGGGVGGLLESLAGLCPCLASVLKKPATPGGRSPQELDEAAAIIQAGAAAALIKLPAPPPAEGKLDAAAKAEYDASAAPPTAAKAAVPPLATVDAVPAEPAATQPYAPEASAAEAAPAAAAPAAAPAAAAPAAAPAAAAPAAAEPTKGYVFGFFDMKDPAEFKNVYSPMAEPTLEPYGGKFVMKHALAPPLAEKMGMKESKGFGATGQMAFMLEFESFEKAMGWFTGPEYAAVLTKRDEVADFKMAVVEGGPIDPGAGLVIGFFDMKDPKEFKEVYSPMAEPTLDPYGGKFAIKHALAPPLAAKMGMKESKGFGATGQMAFVLQFADFEKAMGWFTGPEYAGVLTKRDEVADFKMAVVEAMV